MPPSTQNQSKMWVAAQQLMYLQREQQIDEAKENDEEDDDEDDDEADESDDEADESDDEADSSDDEAEGDDDDSSDYEADERDEAEVSNDQAGEEPAARPPVAGAYRERNIAGPAVPARWSRRLRRAAPVGAATAGEAPTTADNGKSTAIPQENEPEPEPEEFTLTPLWQAGPEASEPQPREVGIGEEFWDQRYAELVRYRNAHGDCEVPWKGRKTLRDWVSNQRAAYKKGKLRQDRKDRLNAIEFTWCPKENKWNRSYAELVRYRNAHGDCEVPKSGSKTLGTWVSTQRAAYKKGKLRQDRLNRLNAIEFTWEFKHRCGNRKKLSATNDVKWNRSYAELVRYRNAHGHCEVMRRGRDLFLGTWVMRQRATCKKGKLRQDRINRLNAIDFTWEIGKGGSGKNSRHLSPRRLSRRRTACNDAKWNHQFAKMLEYKRVHGHCEVPQKEGMLGMWVANQRKAKKSDSLSQDRVDRLNSTGFTWKVQVGKTKLLPEWKRSKEDLIKWDEKLAAVAAGGILSDHQKKWLQEQKQLDMDCKLGDYKSKQLRLLLSKDHKTECAAESAAECVTDCAAECVTECVAESNSEAIEFLNNLGQNDYVEV